MDGRREVRDASRLRAAREWSVVRDGAMPVTLAAWEPWMNGLWELRLDEDRCRREECDCKELPREGDPCMASVGSLSVEVDEALDVTEVVC